MSYLSYQVTGLPPRFNYPENILRISVNEEIKIGSTVVRVHAGGTDYQYGHVNYSMQAWRATIEERENQLFEMNPNGLGWFSNRFYDDLMRRSSTLKLLNLTIP